MRVLRYDDFGFKVKALREKTGRIFLAGGDVVMLKFLQIILILRENVISLPLIESFYKENGQKQEHIKALFLQPPRGCCEPFFYV